jgi:5-methylcytosine-specific restriction endonuclease McrA
MPIVKICDQHQKADNRRRNQKAQDHGRRSARWKHLRAAVLERDNHECQHVRYGVKCGRPATSAHLDPRLKGNHWIATEDDCISMCASCHGSVDAPRSHNRGVAA